MVFIIPDGIKRKYEWKHEGPYEIIQTHTNGTVVIQRESFTERINIRRLTPFFQNKKNQKSKHTKENEKENGDSSLN